MTSTRGQVPEVAPAQFGTVEGVKALLEGTADLVLKAAISPAQAQAIVGLAGVAVRLGELSLSAELRRLEKLVAERLPGGRR